MSDQRNESGVFLSQESADVMARAFDTAAMDALTKATSETTLALKEFGRVCDEVREAALAELSDEQRAAALRLINGEYGVPWMDAIRAVTYG